jgi:rhodanese-related sulfurtransferase
MVACLEQFNGIERSLLQTLVPVNALTDDHLSTLLRDKSVESVFAGQCIFAVNEYDGNSVYLLSGAIRLISDDEEVLLDASDPLSKYPLSHHQPRNCTAIAQTDCSIIRFDNEQLDSMLAWDQVSRYIMLDISGQRDLDEDADWMLTLLKSNLFYKVPPMNIRLILDKFESQYVSSGKTILRQGEIGDSCYYIKEGVAGVYQSIGERSPSELVAELGVGRCFGEDALINEVGRNASIVMHSNGVLMKLKKQDFFLLLKQPTVKTENFIAAKEKIALGAQWIDVRTQDEYEKSHADNTLNMPLDLLKLKSRMLSKEQEYIVYCNSGKRSEAAVYLLTQEGFKVSALSGGVDSCYLENKNYFSYQ